MLPQGRGAGGAAGGGVGEGGKASKAEVQIKVRAKVFPLFYIFKKNYHKVIC